MLDPSLSDSRIVLFGFSLVDFEALFAQLFVLGVVEVLLLELLTFFFHGCDFLLTEGHTKLRFDFQQQRVSGVDVLTPQLLELLDLKVLLIIFLVEFIERGSESSLVSHQFLSEVLGDDQLVHILNPLVATILPDVFDSFAADDIGQPVFGIVNASHHQFSVVLSDLGVEILGLSEQNIAVEGAGFLEAAISLVGEAHEQAGLKDLGVEILLDFVDAFEFLSSNLTDGYFFSLKHVFMAWRTRFLW